MALPKAWGFETTSKSVFSSGQETTRNLVGNGMYTLLRLPAEMEELRENPAMIRSAVEELLRYESPMQYTAWMRRKN